MYVFYIRIINICMPGLHFEGSGSRCFPSPRHPRPVVRTTGRSGACHKRSTDSYGASFAPVAQEPEAGPQQSPTRRPVGAELRRAGRTPGTPPRLGGPKHGDHQRDHVDVHTVPMHWPMHWPSARPAAQAKTAAPGTACPTTPATNLARAEEQKAEASHHKARAKAKGQSPPNTRATTLGQGPGTLPKKTRSTPSQAATAIRHQ